MNSEYNHKYIRDVLYGFIGISKKEDRIINTPTFQRLSRIKQLSNSYLIYPGANHTRFEHSLGVLHLAGIVADRLKLTSYEKRILRLAALTHDLGQGPFSHVFETPMRWINGDDYSHEKVTLLLLKNDKNLSDALGKDLDAVVNIFEDKTHFLHKIITSEFDVDRMDYLRRDSYHAGVAYGLFDLDRLLLSICKISKFGENYFGITEKGMRAIESYRLARFNLSEQVYEHHARLAADDLLCKSIKLAIEEDIFDKERLNINKRDLNAFIEFFNSLDDFSLQNLIMNNSDDKARLLMMALRNRKLPKRAYRIRVDKLGVPDPILRDKIIREITENVELIEEGISEKSNIPVFKIIVHLQNSKIKCYRTMTDDIGISDEILVQLNPDENPSLNELSPLSLQKETIKRLYVFGLCSKQKLKSVSEISQNIFLVKNDLINT